MATYAIGDIHGQLTAFEQCLERCSFDFDQDQLICLGDIADRGPNTYGCFERLLTIKNLIYTLGNHDKWFLDWLNEPEQLNRNWLIQGGRETLESYQGKPIENVKLHHALLQSAKLFYIDKQSRLFLHGGFEEGNTLRETESTKPMEFYWNRSLWKRAVLQDVNISFQLDEDSPVYENDIFIGHYNTRITFPDLKPVRMQNVWNLDQGVAYGGKLTIMNVDTYDYWQSDLITDIVE